MRKPHSTFARLSLDTDRSRDARARAEQALVELALAFGDHAQDLIIIGGLNPDFLAPQAPVQHLGTTDVDLLLELGFVYDRDDLDFAWLEPAFKRAGFEAHNDDGWRWGRVSDSAVVQIDILCDVQDNPDQVIALPGAGEIAAKNLAGPSGAIAAPVIRTLTVTAATKANDPDAPDEIALRFASLGGYLLAKSSALVGRRAVKDAYDFMYVTLYNDRGPIGAAEAILDALETPSLHHDHMKDVQAVLRGYETHQYATWFAQQMRDSGDDATQEQLEEDAKFGARAALRKLT